MNALLMTGLLFVQFSTINMCNDSGILTIDMPFILSREYIYVYGRIKSDSDNTSLSHFKSITRLVLMQHILTSKGYYSMYHSRLGTENRCCSRYFNHNYAFKPQEYTKLFQPYIHNSKSVVKSNFLRFTLLCIKSHLFIHAKLPPLLSKVTS